MRRRALRGVATDLLNSFVSRSNDVVSYWGIGKLYRYARSLRVEQIRINLLDRRHAPASVEFDSMLRHFSEMLFRLARACHLDPKHIAQAHINLHFGLPPASLRSTQLHGFGDGYRCAIELIDDLGRKYRADTIGRAAPHWPAPLK